MWCWIRPSQPSELWEVAKRTAKIWEVQGQLVLHSWWFWVSHPCSASSFLELPPNKHMEPFENLETKKSISKKSTIYALEPFYDDQDGPLKVTGRYAELLLQRLLSIPPLFPEIIMWRSCWSGVSMSGTHTTVAGNMSWPQSVNDIRFQRHDLWWRRCWETVSSVDVLKGHYRSKEWRTFL